MIAFLIFAYFRTVKENNMGDFHVFWHAGKSLINGSDIYFVNPGWRAYIYPPFAAIVFSPLSILPFKVACYLFFLMNVVFFLYTASLVSKILKIFIYDDKIIKFAYWSSLALVFKISWNNLMMVQVNQLVYVFIFLGIYHFLKGNENWAIFFFCISISMKVFPILFAFWVVIRGSRTAFIKFVLGAAVCILLPMVFTGPPKGIEQLNWYYQNFILSNVAPGKSLGSGYASQSLPALLNRTLLPSTDINEPSYTLINLGDENVAKIIHFTQIGFFLIMITLFIYNRIKVKRLNLIEPSITILTIHLISTCTWKAHMVGMILVFAVICTELYKKYYEKKLGIFSKILIIYLIIVSLLGQIFIGKKWQMFLGAYGDYTWLMVFCFIYLIYIFVSNFSLNKKLQSI